MRVSAILENLDGANIKNITPWYAGLGREQVKTVTEFAVQSLLLRAGLNVAIAKAP